MSAANTVAPDWLNPVSYTIVVYFILIVLFTIYYKIRKIIPVNNAGLSELPWIISNNIGMSHKQYQISQIFSIVVIYVLSVVYAASKNVDPVIIGSLLGALPVIIFELNREIQKPHVTLEDVQIIKYPDQWWVFGTKRTHHNSNNSVGVHVTIRNDGRETVENCTVRLLSDGVDNQQYHTRWSNQNQLMLELSPEEEQTADLLWIDLRDEIVKTADPNVEDNERHHPPGSYAMISRPELSTDFHKLSIVVSGDNIPENKFQVNISEKRQIQMPNDIIQRSSEWDVITSIKRKPNEPYAIQYRRKTEEVLEIPDTLTDIDYLSRINKFSESELQRGPKETYEDALDRNYTVRRT